VQNQLDVLLPQVDVEPESKPEPTSESTPMTTKKAVKLLEKILKDNQLIEDLEDERKEVDPKRRGPRRSDTDGVVKHYRQKEQTRREKLRKDIRKARKRIGYNWGRLKAAAIVTEPEASTAEHSISSKLSHPVVLVAANGEGDEDSGAMADDSDSEPALPTGNFIARSIMSPSVPPDHTAEEEDRISNDKEEAETERSGENGDDDTEASKVNEPVEKKAAHKLESFSRSVQSSLLPFAALRHDHRTTRAPRRSIYTPDSVDDEDHPRQTRQEEILTLTVTEENSHSAGGLADQTVEKTANPTNPGNVDIQVKSPSRRSVTPFLLSSAPWFNHDLFSSSENDLSDSGEDEDSSDDDEDDSSDVEVKVEEDEDADVKLDLFDDDSEDDDEDEDESSDAKVKVELEDEEAKESSEDTGNEQDKKADGVPDDIENQKKERLVGHIPSLSR
jgi:hypothetical protein